VLLATIAACCAMATVHAIDPERSLSQYIRSRWERSNGFPGGYVYAITQTADGYLWIAAEKGLVRFDGSSYRLFQPRELTSGSDTTALELVPGPGGGLWARLRRAAFVRFHDGIFEEGIKRDTGPTARITAIAAANDGAILVADADEGLIATRGNGFDVVAARRALPGSSVTSIAQASNGDLWLGTLDAGLLQIHNGNVTRIANERLPDQKINCLLTDARDRVWVGTDHGVFRWNAGTITQVSLEPASGDLHALSMLEDHDGNVWIGTADGLLRIHGDGPSLLDRRTRATAVTALFEDRDGDLWIGTASGIERWRDGAFTAYPDVEALASATAGPILVDAARRAWFAPSSGGLYWVRDGQVGRVTGDGLRDDVVYSIAGDGDDLWIGRQHGGLTHLHLHARTDAFTMRTFTIADGLAQNNVYAVHRARDGAVWAGTLSAGASRLADGVFTTYTTTDGLLSNTVASVLEASDGTMWFATPNGVSARSASGWRRYSTADGLPSDDVNTLFEDSVHDMWIGTASGLAMVRAGRVYTGLRLPESLQASILGMAEDRVGWLWIATAQHVLRVDRQRLVLGSLGTDGLREFGIADGLPGIAGIRRHRSVAADAQGRIWISTDGGLAMADPLRIARGCAPALVHVEDLSADGSSVALVAAPNVEPPKIKPGRQRITLTFAGLSFPVPERVRYRYWLEGFDHDWSAPVAERQAVYTNLGPGTYRFRIIASNSDGAWTGTEASLPFTIEPAFWQTAWFQLSVVLLCVTAAWAAYRVRVMQVSRQLTLRFEERLAERTRVAQELHDTLLQGVISASMQLHVAATQLPGDSDSKPSLSRVIELIGRVIEEARTAVQGLRSASTASGLEHAFCGIRDELGTTGPAAYRVVVEGRDRPLNPLIRDEVYRIGREAVVNAFRHAEARKIELVLEYASSGLRLVVRDDGRGIDASVLQSGTDGHWGLTGMRERADRIGARFKAWSRAGAGTEIELCVPARIAFTREKHERKPRPARLPGRSLP
jgi:ligand-binding sensor domain-containing protein